ncbi:MAG: Ig-like domain-containing protein [Verrucomicrobiota bacterium]
MNNYFHKSAGRLDRSPASTINERTVRRLTGILARLFAVSLAWLFCVSGPQVLAAVLAGPLISGPSAISIIEDSGITNIDYTITDATAPAFAIRAWATTSNESLVSIDNLSVLGLGKNKKLSFFPTANANGAAILTLFASDGAITNSKAITLTVNSVDDIPSFTLSTNTLVVLEDSAAYTNTAFVTSISRGPTNESAQTLTFVLTPQTPGDTSKFAIQPVITVTGTNSVATLIFKPALNQNGSVPFDVQMQDSGGTTNSGVNLTLPQTLTINITSVNDLPVINSVTNIVMDEDSTTNLVVNVTDVESSFSSILSSNAWFVSSNSALLDPTTVTVTRGITNFSLAISPTADLSGTNVLSVVVEDGAGARATNNITIVVRPVNDKPTFNIATTLLTMAEDAGLQTSLLFATGISSGGGSDESGQSITFLVTASPTNSVASISINAATGALAYQTAANFNGAITVTARLQDNGGTNFGGVNLSDPLTFTIDVTAVNDPPTISGLPTTLTMFEDKSTTNTFRVTDPEDPAASLTILNATWDASLFSNVSFSGSGTNRTMIITPKPNANTNGSSTITVTTDDLQLTNFTTSTSIAVTLTAVNDRPSISVLGNQTVLEDAVLQTVNNFVTTNSVGPTNESTQLIINYLVTTSSNAFFTSLPTISLLKTLTYQPAPNASGTVTVKVQAQDDGGTNNGGVDLSLTNSFTITVTPVNDPPVIAGLPPTLTMYEDRATNITFRVTDIDTAMTNVILSATASSDLTTIPLANVTFTGTGTNRTMTILSATNLSGTPITITVQADDQSLVNNTFSTNIVVTVIAVNDPPSFTLTAASVRAQKFGVLQSVPGFATVSKGPAEQLSGQIVSFTVTTTAPRLFLVPPAVDSSGTLTYAITNGASGSIALSIYATDDGGTANGGSNRSSTNSFTIIVPANPFQFLSGEFNGLFYMAGGVTFTDGGFLKFIVDTNGVITSATTTVAGKSYVLTSGIGQYNIDDSTPTAQFTVDRSADSLANLVVTAVLDASDSWTETFSGTVACTAWVTSADLGGDHAYKDTYTFKYDGIDSVDAGKYTLIVPGNGATNTASPAPSGYGWGTVTVDADGTVHLAGELADGQVIAQTNNVSVNGTWPLFANLYTGSSSNGVALGWVTFDTTEATNDLSGLVSWIMNPDSGAADYTNGFANDSTLQGSVYQTPALLSTVFGAPSGTLTFSEGGLNTNPSAAFTNFAFPVHSLTTANNGATPAVSITVVPSNGSFTGTFDDDITTTGIPFKGVVFQKTALTNPAYGYFINTATVPANTSAGSLVIGP